MNLIQYVKKVSREDFGLLFQHEAVWNTRLRTTGGRFFPKDGHLEFNVKLYENIELKTFRQIVRHELCHYHLYFAGKGYRHKDRDFKELLKQVDGLRYAPSIREKQFYHYYQCQSCGQLYQRKKRLNTQKFVCGKCRGKLREQNQNQS
ncbi:SprT family protein [Streptococcus macacae]|uniref:Protein SprT-like n=1 Tax=Streptococcus macacae NCTC 11558 TaxID=764298 RepID=G5JYM1_9STRE|nr:SprT family protein [Streptococcus macacae]EHJ52558.1 SprT-like family protein [Streptococcus macacae NCTC 11558]SUN78134.1 SprT family metallopeptidase [Streptococcus macacae NCTC 11558]